MATNRPISTISYNSEGFLKEKLESWLKAHIIQAYQYIKHKGEDGDKDHIHLRIEPNKRLDQMDLIEDLREFPPGQKKPLGVRPWRPSKEEDWFLYALHDPDYMRLKYADGKGEKIPYQINDIVCSDGYDVEVAVIRARSYLKNTSSNVASRIRKGEDLVSMVEEGASPFLVNSVYHLLAKNEFDVLNRTIEIQAYNIAYLIKFLEDSFPSKGKIVFDYDADGRIVNSGFRPD